MYKYLDYFAGSFSDKSNRVKKYLAGDVLIESLLAGMVLKMNLRRKRIQKEFIYELDKDIRSKEVLCPSCGAKIGASGICPKCGYCRKN